MPYAILKTKIHAPLARRDLVRRSRLVTRLNDGLQQKLTLLSAPAGFGKTMLLGEWVANCGRPVAWVSLDETDSDLSRFWSYFIAALGTIRANIGEAVLTYLQSPQPLSTDVLLTTLMNEISDKLPPFVLVLDDYHTLTSSQVHDALEFLLDHLPPQMHLVISGRADPPLPLARLRAHNELNELRAVDLRFTLEETTAFFNELMKLQLSAEEIGELARRTEGWVASLRMIAISLRGQDSIHDFVFNFSGSHRYILDYLADEVLTRQDDVTRSFLLQTSILKRLSGALCDAVTGRKDGTEMLKHLEADNLFVESLDEERNWYRYHQLFADLLASQLARLQPDLQIELHRRASSWFEHEGLTEEAIYHILAARDFEKSADLMDKASASLIEQSQISSLLGWLSALPQETIARRPWLCICNAWALLLGGQLDIVEPFLQAAEMRLADTPVPLGEITSEYSARVRGHSLAIRAYIVRARGDIPRSIELSLEASRLLPANEMTARSANALNLGNAYFMTGDVVNASKYSESAYKIASAGGNLYVALESVCSLGELQIEQGRLHHAAETFKRAVKLGQKWGGRRPLPATATAYNGLGRLQYEWNNMDAALRYVKQGVELAEFAHLWYTEYLGYAVLGLIKQLSGENEAAMEAVEKAAAKVPPGTMFDIHASSWKARLLIAQNDVAVLRQWVSSSEAVLNPSAIPDYWFEAPFLVLARARIVLGEVGHLPDLLRRLLEKAEGQARTNSAIKILIIQALALTTLDKNDDAIISLQKALALAEPEGLVRTFIDEGPVMQRLLRQIVRKEAPADYLNYLLANFPRPGVGSPIAINQPETSYIEHLNQREREILKLMAAGLSNQKIADRLYISVNTVKWHTRQIFDKLQVSGRTQAVNRARDLDIL